MEGNCKNHVKKVQIPPFSALFVFFLGGGCNSSIDDFLLGQKVPKMAKKVEVLLFLAEILRWLKCSHIYRVLRQTLLVPSQFGVADSVSDIVME